MHQETEQWIQQTSENQQKILWALHHLIVEVPEITSKIRYKIPFYYRKSWICYLSPKKTQEIELVFLRGQELSNEQGILESKDRKQVSGILLSSLDEFPEEAIREILQEAILLDETVPYSVKKK